MAKPIAESNNYKLFEMTPFNRDTRKLRYLEHSMRKHGWIDAYPMHVFRNGSGKLQIKAGHHRFVVAQKIGIPVKYVECKDTASIFELEKATVRWSMNDYLVAHCRSGLQEYLTVRDYCDESGITLQAAISMLGGNAAGSGNFQQAFKEGNYKIRKDCNHAEVIKDLVLFIKRCGVPFYNSAPFVHALSRVALVEEFNPSHMKQKVRAFAAYLEKKATLEQYIQMIQEIYNRQSQKKIPLAFLADETAKRRNVIGIQKQKRPEVRS